MAGISFKIQKDITDPEIPTVWAHPLLSKGSLLLMNLNNKSVEHPTDLTNGALIQNVAWRTAKALTGASSQDDVAMTVKLSAAYSGSVGKVEITAKKGIHAIISQVNHTLSSQAFNVTIPQKVREYIIAHPTHKYYISQIKRNTRLAVNTSFGFAELGIAFSSTANCLAYANPTANGIINSSGGGRRNGLSNTLGLSFKNIETLEPHNSNPITSVADNGNFIIASGGGVAAFNSSSFLNKCPSYITYQVYIEDLDVSGRTYSEVDELDFELYQQSFASGGEFYDDDYTDPETLP